MKINTAIVSLFLSVLLSVIGSTATAAAECVSKAEMQEIASHFTQFKAIAQKDYCPDGSQTSYLLATIMFMRKTAFATEMPKSQDQLFSGRFATSWYQYFIGRINDMSIENSCPAGVAAYVYGFGGHTMYVCPAALTENFSALDRASIFMHEARHIDGFPHITCSQGARKGLQGACDTRISDGGSYAVTVETYAQLAKYATDLHPALKAYSKASAVVYADEAFDTPAQVNRTAQLVAVTNDGAMHGLTFNGTQAADKDLGKVPSLGHIAMRAQFMILFPDDKTLPAKFLFANNVGDVSQSAGDSIIAYNAQTPEQKAQLVDYHVAAQWSARIYKTKINFICSATAPTPVDVSTQNEQPVSILYLKGYDRVARSHYVLMASGALYEFGCDNSSKPVFKLSSTKLDQNYKRIHKIADMVVGLTQDGHLVQITGVKPVAITTNLDGQIYEIAPQESFDFFDSVK